jgi:DNA-binding transcriptional LysR family regulator
MDRLQCMASFVRVVERGSFAAAAEGTRFTATMVGNHVRYLEGRLGARLLNRTTRRHSLTELGRSYYERCRAILHDVEDAEAQASQIRASPRGTLRMTAPITLGTGPLMSLITQYLRRHPEVEVELSLTDRLTDLLEERFEVAIRIGELANTGLVARPLRPYRILLCASPQYLKRHGTPARPSDLATHSCLDFTLSASYGRWTFADGTVLAPRGRLRANSGQALRQAALEGLGIVLVAELLVRDDLEQGTLVQVLTEFGPAARPMHLVTLPDRRPTPKLTSFVQFIADHLGPEPTADDRAAASTHAGTSRAPTRRSAQSR